MSIIRCNDHGNWDSDNHEVCPLCSHRFSQDNIEGCLQDAYDLTGEIQGGLMQEELHISDDNAAEFKDVFMRLQALIPRLQALKRHNWADPAVLERPDYTGREYHPISF